MSPPRLTGALRSFSNVSKKDDIDGQVYDLKVSKRVVNDAIRDLWNKHLETCQYYLILSIS